MNIGGPDDIQLPPDDTDPRLRLIRARLGGALKDLLNVKLWLGPMDWPPGWEEKRDFLRRAEDKLRIAEEDISELFIRVTAEIAPGLGSGVTKRAGGSSEPGGDR